jgi:hypothetical protein
MDEQAIRDLALAFEVFFHRVEDWLIYPVRFGAQLPDLNPEQQIRPIMLDHVR